MCAYKLCIFATVNIEKTNCSCTCMHGVCYHSDHVHIYARSNEHIDFHAKLYIAQAKFSTKHNVSNTIEASWLKGVGRKLLMRMGKTFRVIALVTKVYLNWTKIIDLLLLRWIRSCISVSHLTWAVGSRPGSIYVFCFGFCFCFVLFCFFYVLFLCLVLQLTYINAISMSPDQETDLFL